MTIRVLHVLDKISVASGVSSVVMNYYAKLDHSMITFDFMLNENVNAETRAYIEGNGSKIYIMPALKVANVFRYIKALKMFYKTHNYEVIHGHVANSAIFYLGLAKNIPYRIIHSHSIKSSDIFWKRVRNWFLIRFIKHFANRYFACSEEAAAYLFGKNNDAVILNNAIDVERFIFKAEKYGEMRVRLGLKDAFVIGHIGRFSAVKNHDFLIDVFHEVHIQNENTRLLLIGDGELRNDVEQKAKAFGLSEAVLFLGVANTIESYMNAMDVFVLPSVFEGLGLVGVEAQASGLRVLTSQHVPKIMDVTGNVEFLKPDKSLWVQKLLDIQIRTDRPEQGSKVKGSRFDIDTQVGELCGYYENLLKHTLN